MGNPEPGGRYELEAGSEIDRSGRPVCRGEQTVSAHQPDLRDCLPTDALPFLAGNRSNSASKTPTRPSRFTPVPPASRAADRIRRQLGPDRPARKEQIKKYSTASLGLTNGMFTLTCMLAALTSFRVG